MTETKKVQGAHISITALEKEFGVRPALKGVDLEVPPGEFVAIVGRSGTGKSTLLRLLAGLDEPSRGTLEIRDVTARDSKQTVRVVFQEPRLLPWRSVLDNVLLGLPKGNEAHGRKVLEQVGLDERAEDYPGILSGGQKQRVSLARALVHQPGVMLLDEPFGALDALTRISAQRLVESLWQRHGFTAVLVTHDVEEAVLLGDRVLVMEDGRFVDDVRVDLPRSRTREMPEVGRLTAQLLEAVLGRSASIRPSSPLSSHSAEAARSAFLSGSATHTA